MTAMQDALARAGLVKAETRVERAAAEAERTGIVEGVCPIGKVGYATEKAAKTARNQRNGDHAEVVGTFRCNFCRLFHIGHRR